MAYTSNHDITIPYASTMVLDHSLGYNIYGIDALTGNGILDLQNTSNNDEGVVIVGETNGFSLTHNSKALSLPASGYALLKFFNRNGKILWWNLSVTTADATVTYKAAQTGDITFVDADFQASINGYAGTGYTARSTAGFVQFLTDDTSMSVKVGGNWSGHTSQSNVEVLVNGVWNQSVTLTTDNTTQTVAITLPAGTGKLITLVNGYCANAGADINTSANGVWVQGVVVTGSIQVKIPTTPQNKWLFVGDSITTGASGTHPATSGFPGLFRADGNKFVQVDAYGARTLDTSTTTLANTMASRLVSEMNGSITNEIFLHLGTNNFGLSNQSKATFKTRYGYLLDAIRALSTSITVWCVSPIYRTTYDTANSGGATLDDYADAIRECIAEGRSWAKFIYGKPLVSSANLADGLHPNQTGHQEYHDNLWAKYQAGGDTITITAAPTAGVVDDTNNTFDWTNNPAYTALSDYEYTLDGGATIATVTAKPIAVGDVSKSAGQVGVRVKAVTGNHYASAWLFNATSFTIAAPSATIPSDYVWKLDAGNTSSITKDGTTGAVSAINVGTSINFIQNTASKQPLWIAAALNGYPVIRFDGTDDALTSTYNPTGMAAFTIVAVFKPSRVTGTQAIVEHTSRYGMRVTTGYITVLATVDQTTATTSSHGAAATTNAMLGIFRYKTADWEAYFNKTDSGIVTNKTGNVFDSSTYQLSLGSYIGGTSGYLQGDIAELYFYSRFLTAQEKSDVATVLNNKYAL